MGPLLVEHLDGSEHAKDRLKAVLQTLSGQRRIAEACAELGIQESMFHRLRHEVLQAALDRLEPRPRGRPPRSASDEGQRAAQLEAEVSRLNVELKAAEVRRELAEQLPRLARSSPPAPTGCPGKKTARSKRKRHRRLSPKDTQPFNP